MQMTTTQQRQCHQIIHSHAAAAAAGNAVPVPGLGVAVDTLTMTSMAMLLAGVFGSDIPRSVAHNLAVVALRKTMLQQPLRVVAKELSKLIPGLGQVVAPAVSVAMLEAAGWALARQIAIRPLMAA